MSETTSATTSGRTRTPSAPPSLAGSRVSRGGAWALWGLVGAVALTGLLASAPFVVEPGLTAALVKLFYLVVLATMWNLLAGYAGLVSIGQQAWIGLGAYGLMAVNDLGVDLFAGTGVVAVLVALVAWPVSYLAFRFRAGYFAVGTWVIAEVVRLLVTRSEAMGAGGGRSVSEVLPDPLLRGALTYWTALVVAVAALAVTYGLLRHRTGLDLQAIRDDDVAAASLGVRVVRARRLVYVIAAGGCAAAGAIICTQGLGVASPSQIFGVQYSAFMIFMVVIGGIGTVEGPVVGAVLYFALDQVFGQSGVWYLVLVGAVAVVVSLYAPQGLWGAFTRRTGVSLFPIRHQVHPATAARPKRSAA